jgi:hypothetical protein
MAGDATLDDAYAPFGEAGCVVVLGVAVPPSFTDRLILNLVVGDIRRPGGEGQPGPRRRADPGSMRNRRGGGGT